MRTDDFKSDIQWDDAARQRMKAVPFFLRPMVRKSIEKAAKEKGVSIITSELIDEVKKH